MLVQTVRLAPANISKNKELEATEERKKKAKQLEMQRKEMSRSGRAPVPRVPSYNTYTPPAKTTVTTYDSYEAEKSKSTKSVVKPTRYTRLIACRSAAAKAKAQAAKKSRSTDLFEKVRGDLGPEAQDLAPLISNNQPVASAEKAASARQSLSADRDPVHVTVAESISAKLSKEGTLQSFNVKGDLQLRVLDPTMAKVRLSMVANATSGAVFKTHPNVDKAQFANGKTIQLKDPSKGFPVNQSVGVLRWTATASADAADVAPITFTVWVNKGDASSYNLTIEYETNGADSLRDVVITIPYSTSEPAVSSFDAVYEVSGDALEWTIGTIDDANSSGSFEFEAQAEDESEFFPMTVQFSKSKPFVDVDVSASTLISTET